MTGTLDAYQRVNAQTAENYTFTSADKVTIEVSNLKVTLKEDLPEPVKAENKLASVTVDSGMVKLADAYEKLSDAIANATKINMSSSAAQEYKVVVTTLPSDNADVNTWGGIGLFNSIDAAQDFVATNAEFDADGYTYSNVSVGSYLIINTNNNGEIAYYAYYFG